MPEFISRGGSWVSIVRGRPADEAKQESDSQTDGQVSASPKVVNNEISASPESSVKPEVYVKPEVVGKSKPKPKTNPKAKKART